MNNIPKIVLAMIVQLFAFILLFALIRFLPLLVSPPYHPILLAMLMGIIASLISLAIKLPKWWLWLQLFFPLAIYLAIQQSINPVYYLIAFVVLWLVFSNSFGNRVPLYLTNNKTRQALVKLIEKKTNVKFIDLGSGLGGNVVYLSKQENSIQSLGVETAPIPYLISKINCFINGGEILAEDIWKTPLAEFSLVYAFLSPESMPKLWQKVVLEMDKEAIFVSNSFIVPDIEPSEIWELSDKRKTHLYIYYLKDFKS